MPGLPDFGPIPNSPKPLLGEESVGDEHAEDEEIVNIRGLLGIGMLKLPFGLMEPLAEPLMVSR